ncbi:MAG: helicase-related protein [Hydrogeniiclostridium mannosilyticum]
MGFINDVKSNCLIPQEKQTLLFSATIPPRFEIADRVLRTDKAVIEVTPSATTVEAISQQVCYVDRPNKPKLLVHLLKNMDIPSALVFTRTKHGADRVARQLQKADIPAHSIHGDKSQGARQAALEAFKKGNVRVLVATDIAARGIDIEDLTHVFNFDIPEVPETMCTASAHRARRPGGNGNFSVKSTRPPT